MKSFHSVFLALLAAFTLLPTGCETPDSPQEPSGPVAVESVTVSPQNLELKVGETATLTARILPSNAQGTLSWTSSNTAVASVANGTVTAVAAGSATITASAGGKSASCQVTVKATQTVVEVESVTLDRHEMTLTEGETNRLVAKVSPSNATDKTISWATSNPAIVSVDKEGNVKGVAVGTATVAASHGNLSDACKITVTASAVPVTSISLDKTTLALAEQDTYQLTATVKPDNATDKTVTWSTANAAIATVSNNGLVTAVAEGTTTITAKAGDKTATCSVTVSKKVIPVTSVTLNKTSEQETFQLSATVSPDNATDKTVTWSSSNTAVATVSSNGLVTAVQEGSATITAKAGDKTATCTVTVSKKVIPVTSVSLNKTAGDKTATCTVTVSKKVIPVTSFTFGDDWFYVEKDHTLQLPFQSSPTDANETLTWTSSAPSYVSVDQNGLVSGLKIGTVTITVKGSLVNATCKVTCHYIPTGITLNATNLTMEVEDTFQMQGTVNKRPEDTNDYGISWSSADPSIAKISSSGLVTAVSPGTTTLRAGVYGGVEAFCTVTVTKKTVYVTSITLDRTSLEIARGDTYTLQATVLPDDAVNKAVTWTSSNKSVATVDSNGKVTGVKAGTATITAKAGDKTATCEVKVIIPVTSITLNLSSKTLRQNETVKLTATVKPTDATYKDVTWTSDNPQVASVSSDGTVTAVSEGTANISAKAGDQTATCVITVSNAASGSHEGTGTEVWY